MNLRVLKDSSMRIYQCFSPEMWFLYTAKLLVPISKQIGVDKPKCVAKSKSSVQDNKKSQGCLATIPH